MTPTFFDNGKSIEHPLELKFNAPAWDILSAIERGFRAQVDVKGKLAEWFLYKQLVELKDRGIIEAVTWHDADGKPDFDVVIEGRTIRIECKNVRSGKNPKGYQGNYRVEIQKTRNQLTGGPARGYKVDEFEILAACLFNQNGIWEYVFVQATRLERRPEFPDYLVIMQPVPPQRSEGPRAARARISAITRKYESCLLGEPRRTRLDQSALFKKKGPRSPGHR